MARRRFPAPSYQSSAVIGCVLLGIVGAWLLWLLLGQHGVGPILRWGVPRTQQLPSTPGAEAQVPVLLAHGITLTQPTEEANLSLQQALFLARQSVPDAIAAKNVSARYVLVNSSMAQEKLQNVPTWVVWYQSIPRAGGGTQDLYVFLDANSGTQLFSLWV